jgi:hypothetical protein
LRGRERRVIQVQEALEYETGKIRKEIPLNIL